jgi:glycosyltransferase involved in cell wall biosynthesis
LSLHILHTESSCGWGGQELRILTEAQDMVARGHRLHLAADPSSRIAERAAHYGMELTTLPIKFKSVRGFMALRRLIARGGFDIINAHSSTDAWLAGLAAASLAAAPPVVRTRHISAPFRNNFLTRWIYNRACAAIVTTGEALRQEMIRTLGTPPAQVWSIPTGIDTQVFRPAEAGLRAPLRVSLGLPVDAYLVGIVATLRSWKGHADLINALALLSGDGSAGHWHLVIVGDGPQRGNLTTQIAQMGLGDRVTMAGHQDEPADWFRSLDLFCLPSYANEGVPQALMQAMACGLPCVTTSAGAITEAIEHGISGIVVAPRDLDALRSSVLLLSGDAALSAQLGLAARARAESRFGRTQMTDRMLALFEALARGTPNTRSLAP